VVGNVLARRAFIEPLLRAIARLLARRALIEPLRASPKSLNRAFTCQQLVADFGLARLKLLGLAQFTCFTGTKVQILTQKEQRQQLRAR
jgi:hypothetical protein